ncbi:hypothetical protein [Chondromyces crocatus]|uniref:Transposase (putative) YhgA-like domain-containing protein n=1 Tax=Chondromyces crocatus TaxID=52 RepID=A0A0K1EF40_CHOCO|nr:hypothetical protein [Chondromyces crocatus]AKT39469.1 uncharacterized protein CMC5_036160 [Chondromyces crocatus]
MPSLIHEALLMLFKDHPSLAAEFLRDVLGAPLPRFSEVRVEPADLTEVVPAAHYADLVVLLLKKRPVLAIVVEVQLGRDPEKAYSWPSYAVAVRARYRCRVCLLVVTTDEGVARWAAEPIELGPPNFVLRPYVLGPRAVPLITDPAEARARPEIAVLSAMAHGRSEAGLSVALAALAAAAGLEEERQKLYVDVIMSSLNEAAKRSLEAMMKSGYEFESEFARRYVAQGRKEGAQSGALKAKAEAVIAVLEARELEVPESAREHILTATDLNELDCWIRRAAVVREASELFTV